MSDQAGREATPCCNSPYWHGCMTGRKATPDCAWGDHSPHPCEVVHPDRPPLDVGRKATVTEVEPPRKTVKGWRWDVVIYRPTDPVHPGVYDGRLHLDRQAGYTRTRWGAWRRIRAAVSSAARQSPSPEGQLPPT